MTRPLPRRFRLPWRRLEVDPSAELGTPELAEPVAPSLQVTRATRWSETFRAFRHRNYRLFYWGQAISLSGSWMQTVAQSWLVLEITDSKVALGLVTMLQFLPITLFVLIAGVIADRLPKRDLILATRVLAMVQSVLLALLVATDQVELWHVYVLALVLGFSTAFEQPARQAFAVEMVGKEDLLNAVALNTGLFNGARVIGPSIAGVLIAVIGLEAAFFINAVSFLPTIWALLAMDMDELHTTEARRDASSNPFRELGEGISYAFRTPAPFLIIIIAFFIGMFGFNFLVVLPLVARYALEGGSVLLGFLWAALGVGAVVSALVLAARRTFRRRTIFLGGAAFAVLLTGIALSNTVPLTVLLLFGLGVALTAFASTANTALQLATPDHLRGRVMALWMLLFAGSTPFGGYLTGFLAEEIGVREAIGINAAICAFGLGLALLYYFTHRERVEASAIAEVPATA
ncbi:MAG: MFS transporter [Geminicoccales bacterium]